ncbi:hypothetical protein ACM6Q0_14330, partial [Enterococcus faecium]|uniref:hypothetical protein n=1 Tax=Enterococcus faecium TaxID=1352 RepID=UPI0039FD9715
RKQEENSFPHNDQSFFKKTVFHVNMECLKQRKRFLKKSSNNRFLFFVILSLFSYRGQPFFFLKVHYFYKLFHNEKKRAT